MEILTNREIALIFWICILIVFSVIIKNIRQSVYKVIRILLSMQMQLFIVISGVYFVLLLFVINKIYYLNNGLIKDSFLWFLINGLYVTLKIITNRNSGFKLISRLKENISLIILIELLVNTYVFPVFIEILIVPISFFVYLFLDVVENHENKELILPIVHKVKNVLNILFLSYLLLSFIQNYKEIINLASLIGIILPLIFIILYFPLQYFQVFYSKYNELTVIIKHVFGNIKKPEIGKYLLKKIRPYIGLSIKKIDQIKSCKYYFWHNINTVEEVDFFITCNKHHIDKRILF